MLYVDVDAKSLLVAVVADRGRRVVAEGDYMTAMASLRTG